VGPDTTVFRVEGSRLLQVFSEYLGIDTTTGSCPDGHVSTVTGSLVATRDQASSAASIAAVPAGYPAGR
jgi:hypothetical protein